MGVQHTQTSVKNKPKTPEELAAELEAVKTEKAALEVQVTDLQIALCDVYEQFDALTAAAAGTGV